MPASTLDFSGGNLSLSRPGKAASLRAWDAADELLLTEAVARITPSEMQRVLVVDDQFGALTLGLSAFGPDVVADSAVLPVALVDNARRNPELPPPVAVRSWLNPPEGPYHAIVLRIPRHSDYLAWLLRWVNGVLADDGLLLAGGMIKHLPDRSVDVFAQAVQTEEVCPARKKARVIVCRPGTASLTDWSGAWKGYALDRSELTVQALPAVFAREKLDIGTRLFLPHVRESVSVLSAGDRVLDLACGNGVVGLAALTEREDLELTFSDVSSQAVASAQRNLSEAFPSARVQCLHADGIDAGAGQFERILLNPPFHEGGVVGDHIALRLFAQAKKHLSPTGRLLMVGNRHLGYHRSLRTFFPVVRQLDANPKFVVLEAAFR
ncbi:class I SAM-dependent methyltransferase [Marinobacter sp. chi1]|uniref:Class I SAM-dependent methyltransferase n=1 Tax=Marinobacter suaedae TaxID=3057675 RepID=A0ABT8VW53_9GAMM|nr:class I SAM-dependent methyltransferase [Marinobacter sp. chi1]MDO3720216.1 class I SAM-dependent methyltransferase [Marinobacter sp. chi1]